LVNLSCTHGRRRCGGVPSLPLAHEKWFVDDPGAFGADWNFALAAPC
jgi:hypothetical protein